MAAKGTPVGRDRHMSKTTGIAAEILATHQQQERSRQEQGIEGFRVGDLQDGRDGEHREEGQCPQRRGSPGEFAEQFVDHQGRPKPGHHGDDRQGGQRRQSGECTEGPGKVRETADRTPRNFPRRRRSH